MVKKVNNRIKNKVKKTRKVTLCDLKKKSVTRLPFNPFDNSFHWTTNFLYHV